MWNDTIYIPITNWGETTQNIKQIDFSKCSWLPKCYGVSLLDENGLKHLGKFRGKRINLNLQIDSKDIYFLVIRETSGGNGLCIFNKKTLVVVMVCMVLAVLLFQILRKKLVENKKY